MSETAFMRQYRQEAISAFEFGQSTLRMCCTTQTQMNGNEAIFLVAGSGGAEAVTRGVNGMIPSRADDNEQYTITLKEWHDLVTKSGFNVFASQGDQKRIMQQTSMKVINRKIDDTILAELDNSTQSLTISGSTASDRLNYVTSALAILGNNDVDVSDMNNLFGVMSPSFRSYLMQNDAFTNNFYVDVKPLAGGPLRQMIRWAGVNWIVHSRVPNVGTSTEHLFVFHRDAIGHAANTETMDAVAGYDEKQDQSWARTSIYMGSKILQNTGIVKLIHDGSAMVAA